MKKLASLVIALTAVTAITAAALAGAPFDGTYKSSLGQFNEGREGSSWVGSNFLDIGNVLHGESWDGSTLGTDWKILCPEVVRVRLILDLAPGGTGQRIYQLDYRGGYVELSGGGPWGNGDPVYTCAINQYYEFRTIQYVGGGMVGSVSDHTANATVLGYGKSCVTFGIANGVWLNSGKGVPPSGYPDWRRSGCAPLSAAAGHWGDLRDLTITIQGCAVPVAPVTWGAVKAIYR